MNTSRKHDSHPGAESLSAFAEQALGERERGQVLKHLATCGRCRQVVALAQSAAVAEIRPDAPQASRRFLRVDFRFIHLRFALRFAWIPAAALAATVTLAVFVHMRHVEQSAEMAKNERQRVTQAAATLSAPAQPEQAQAAPPAHAPQAAKSPARASKRASEGTAPGPPSVTAAMPAPFLAEPRGVEQSEGARAEAAPPSAAAEPGFAGAAPERPTAPHAPEPPVNALQQERQQKAPAGAAPRHMYAARAAAPASVHSADTGAAGEAVPSRSRFLSIRLRRSHNCPRDLQIRIGRWRQQEFMPVR